MEVNKIIINEKNNGDKGSLSFFEGNNDIPFEIKRVYYIYNVNDSNCVRGKHAHHETDQVMFVIKGSLRMIFDDGEKRNEFMLDKPYEGVLIPHMIWHEMDHFSEDCIALVVASSTYNEKDYIRNYEDFLVTKGLK